MRPPADMSALRKIVRLADSLRKQPDGGIAAAFALALPVVAVAVVSAVEFAEVATTKTKLQRNLDEVALSSAREYLTGRSDATLTRARTDADAGADPSRPRWTIETSVTNPSDSASLTVSQKGWRPSLFGNLVPPGGFSISVTSTARALATSPLCVMGLSVGDKQVLALSGATSLSAKACGVQSNSDISVSGAAQIQAAAIRSVGAASVSGSGSTSPLVTTDAPLIPDPLASLNIIVPQKCTTADLTTNSGTTVLAPGVHCGSYNFGGSSTVVLSPGDHYFVGDSFQIGGSAIVTGDDVVMVFKGQSKIDIGNGSTILLEGRKSGAYAGFIMVADRGYTGSLTLAALSAKRMHGTLYLPNASLEIGGSSGAFAAESAWTVIIARRISLAGSVNVVVNSNYSASPVPVPSGVGSKTLGSTVRIVN